MVMIKALYEREVLKMQILADEPKIPAFIMNSYRLWALSRFGEKTPEKIFYGSGTLRDVLGRLLARKSCMAAWRQTKQDDKSLRLIEPMATILDHSRRIAGELQSFLGSPSPYDALKELQTSGYIDPLTDADIMQLKRTVLHFQQDERLDIPKLSREKLQSVIFKLVDVAKIDFQKVTIKHHVAHPACLGYGGGAQGVMLGLTYDYDDPILGILTNWHEIGHAVYRQAIPEGKMIHGRAMDEAVAFLYENVIGRGDDFLQLLLDEGLKDEGFDIGMMRIIVRHINRQTKRIETNPIRHVIDITFCEKLERAMINEDIEAEDAEIFWENIIAPHTDILPDDYPFYWDVHQMTGIYGDRASYNPGMLGAFQLGACGVTLDNLHDFVTNQISLCPHKKFSDAVETITCKPLETKPFMDWVTNFYG